jgi:hypothetical protein
MRVLLVVRRPILESVSKGTIDLRSATETRQQASLAARQPILPARCVICERLGKSKMT